MARDWLCGKTALVTGAAKRIGHQVAVALADEGANVIIHYRDSADEAAALQRELAARAAKSWLVRADFAHAGECESLVQRSVEAAGSLDMLVNSAAVFPPSTLQDLGFEHLVHNLRVNAWAPLVLGREFARLAGRGKIVNLLDSRLAHGHDRSHVGYFLSKQVLAAVTRMMALEYAPEITVNAVAPGLILPPPGRDDSYLEGLVDTVPMRRRGQPADVAQAVVYLLQADFVTGQVINVDGGRHLAEWRHGPHSDQ